MRWADHVISIVETRSAYNILIGKTNGKDDLEHLGVDGGKILK
jgi:hypothetical protein